MHVDKVSIILFLWVFALVCGGCATTTAPLEWLPEPTAVQSTAFGGWVSVKYTSESSKKNVHGELLAVHRDELFVLTKDSLVIIPKSHILKAKLTAYDANAEYLAGLSLLGCISTGSHGLFLLISAPAWLISGTIITGYRSYEPQVYYSKRYPVSWDEFRKYARFPQGFPQGLERRELELKRGKRRRR